MSATKRVALAHILVLALIALFSFVPFLACGCGSDTEVAQEEYRKTGQLGDFQNDIELDASQAGNPGIVKGTVTKMQTTPNGLLVMVKVSSFRIVGTSDENQNQTLVPPGTEVVIEARDPVEGLAEGKNIEALVRFAKTSNGLRLVADNVRLEP